MSEGADGQGRAFGGGRYVLKGLLGEGGMARVWQAHDVKLGVDRAVKELVGEGRALAVRSRRLMTEARAMVRLSHPHIVPVHDVLDTDTGPVIVMDLVRGGTLEDRLKARGRVAPRRATVWMIQVLDALQAAHERGIVHRDVKPSNVLLDDRERAMLGDFGIALLADDDRHTRTGVSMGSVAYMAPEQRLDARTVGPTADVYAAAATLYHLVTGATSVDLFIAEPDSPRWEGVPAALRGPVFRATRLDPGKRHPTAAALAADLHAVLDDLPEVPGDVSWMDEVRADGGLSFGETAERELGVYVPMLDGTLAPGATDDTEDRRPPAGWVRWGAPLVALVAGALLMAWWVGPGTGHVAAEAAHRHTGGDAQEDVTRPASGEDAADEVVPDPAVAEAAAEGDAPTDAEQAAPRPSAVRVPSPDAAEASRRPAALYVATDGLPVGGVWMGQPGGVMTMALRVGGEPDRVLAELTRQPLGAPGEARVVDLAGRWRNGRLTLTGRAIGAAVTVTAERGGADTLQVQVREGARLGRYTLERQGR